MSAETHRKHFFITDHFYLDDACKYLDDNLRKDLESIPDYIAAKAKSSSHTFNCRARCTDYKQSKRSSYMQRLAPLSSITVQNY